MAVLHRLLMLAWGGSPTPYKPAWRAAACPSRRSQPAARLRHLRAFSMTYEPHKLRWMLRGESWIHFVRSSKSPAADDRRALLATSGLCQSARRVIFMRQRDSASRSLAPSSRCTYRSSDASTSRRCAIPVGVPSRSRCALQRANRPAVACSRSRHRTVRRSRAS